MAKLTHNRYKSSILWQNLHTTAIPSLLWQDYPIIVPSKGCIYFIVTVLTAIPESQALGCKIDSIIARHDAQRTSLVLPLTSLVRGTDRISLITIRRIYNDII